MSDFAIIHSRIFVPPEDSTIEQGTARTYFESKHCRFLKSYINDERTIFSLHNYFWLGVRPMEC